MRLKTKWTMGLAVAALVILYGISQFVVVRVADQLVSPPRRAIQDYHKEWLERSTTHGIQIERLSCLAGDVPCLLVTPISSGTPSERGAVIRRQVAGMGHTLGAMGEVHGTLVLLHGRKGRKEDLLPVAERFCAVGYRCVIPDLPAHGENARTVVHYGAGNQEGDFAWQVLSEVIATHGGAHLPAGIWGISMGGAFAAKTLSVHPAEWDCAVIVSSFDSLGAVIRDQSRARAWILGPMYSQALQDTLSRRHGLDVSAVEPVKWVGLADVPVLVAHGTTDSLFPLKRGRALHDAIPSRRKSWVEVEGGDHDNVLVTPMPLYATMAAWFLEHMPNSHQTNATKTGAVPSGAMK